MATTISTQIVKPMADFVYSMAQSLNVEDSVEDRAAVESAMWFYKVEGDMERVAYLQQILAL